MTDRSAATGGSTSQGVSDGSNITPSASDPVAAAQASLNKLVDRFTDSGSLTHAERSDLFEDIRSAVAHVDELKRGRR